VLLLVITHHQQKVFVFFWPAFFSGVIQHQPSPTNQNLRR